MAWRGHVAGAAAIFRLLCIATLPSPPVLTAAAVTRFLLLPAVRCVGDDSIAHKLRGYRQTTFLFSVMGFVMAGGRRLKEL